MHRREALSWLGGLAATLAGCGNAAEGPKTPATPNGASLHLTPASDLIAGGSLVWLVEARLRELFANPELIPAIHILVPESALDGFAARNGGLDPRQLLEIAYATYPEATLLVARGPLDPTRIEKAFTTRAEPLDGRGVDVAHAPDGKPFAPVVRVWGTVRGSREQLAVFGRDAVALERGRLGPLRAAEAFAQGRLKRAKPALRTTPLARAAELAGEAPLRGFAQGPFEGELAGGFGGLLKASTALAIAVRPSAHATPRPRADVKLVLLGGWGAAGSGTGDTAASERLGAWFARLSEDPLGTLCGIDRPIEGPKVGVTDEALTLEVAVDAVAVAKGLRAATGASIDEIMAH